MIFPRTKRQTFFEIDPRILTLNRAPFPSLRLILPVPITSSPFESLYSRDLGPRLEPLLLGIGYLLQLRVPPLAPEHPEGAGFDIERTFISEEPYLTRGYQAAEGAKGHVGLGTAGQVEAH